MECTVIGVHISYSISCLYSDVHVAVVTNFILKPVIVTCMYMYHSVVNFFNVLFFNYFVYFRYLCVFVGCWYVSYCRIARFR